MVKAGTATPQRKASSPRQATPGKEIKDKKPVGRSLWHFHPLNEMEKELLAACEAGRWAMPVPDPARLESEKPVVRADFIRFLVLGGDEEAVVHEKGVRLLGACVSGSLDFEGCVAERSFFLAKCDFQEMIVLRASSLKTLGFYNCALAGIEGDRLECRGSFFINGSSSSSEIRLLNATVSGSLDLTAAALEVADGDALSCDGITVHGDLVLRDGFRATGPTRLLGSKIGGDLNCIGGRFEGRTEPAISCERATVSGGVFFREGFHALGEVRLHGLSTDGNFDCGGGRFENPEGQSIVADGLHVGRNAFFNGGFHSLGALHLNGVTICGSVDFKNATLEAENRHALHCEGSRIAGHLFYRSVACSGGISLIDTHVAAICDDENSWKAPLLLQGFCFERIDDGPMDADSRIAWLKLQSPQDYGELFWPQPWEHLSQVLRQMGHVETARLVAMEKQRELRRRGVIGNRRPGTTSRGPLAALDVVRVWTLNRVDRLLHRVYGALAGYGYRPLRTFMLMTFFWLLATGVFASAESRGLFVPSAPSLLTDARFQACGPRAESGIRWTRCPHLPRDYTTFDPLMYSLDVILPLVDLRQEADWEPLVRRGQGWQMWDGLLVRGIMWAEILFGWIGSLLIVAALGRLVQKD